MTYTKQTRSVPVIDKPDRENAGPFPFQLVKKGPSALEEINNSLTSIQFSLSNLYTKLLKLNAALIQQKQLEIGTVWRPNAIDSDAQNIGREGSTPTGQCRSYNQR